MSKHPRTPPILVLLLLTAFIVITVQAKEIVIGMSSRPPTTDGWSGDHKCREPSQGIRGQIPGQIPYHHGG